MQFRTFARRTKKKNGKLEIVSIDARSNGKNGKKWKKKCWPNWLNLYSVLVQSLHVTFLLVWYRPNLFFFLCFYCIDFRLFHDFGHNTHSVRCFHCYIGIHIQCLVHIVDGDGMADIQPRTSPRSPRHTHGFVRDDTGIECWTDSVLRCVAIVHNRGKTHCRSG